MNRIKMNPILKHVADDCLEHHGILGQRWGKRNGPPYPLEPSSRSSAEKKANGDKHTSSAKKAYGETPAVGGVGGGAAAEDEEEKEEWLKKWEEDRKKLLEKNPNYSLGSYDEFLGELMEIGINPDSFSSSKLKKMYDQAKESVAKIRESKENKENASNKNSLKEGSEGGIKQWLEKAGKDISKNVNKAVSDAGDWVEKASTDVVNTADAVAKDIGKSVSDTANAFAKNAGIRIMRNISVEDFKKAVAEFDGKQKDGKKSDGGSSSSIKPKVNDKIGKKAYWDEVRSGSMRDPAKANDPLTKVADALKKADIDASYGTVSRWMNKVGKNKKEHKAIDDWFDKEKERALRERTYEHQNDARLDELRNRNTSKAESPSKSEQDLTKSIANYLSSKERKQGNTKEANVLEKIVGDKNYIKNLAANSKKASSSSNASAYEFFKNNPELIIDNHYYDVVTTGSNGKPVAMKIKGSDMKKYFKSLKHSYDSRNNLVLTHHGILGQRWGKKNGPPYPLEEGQKSSAEKKESRLKSYVNYRVDSAIANHEQIRLKRKEEREADRLTKKSEREQDRLEERERKKQKKQAKRDRKEARNLLKKPMDKMTDEELIQKINRIRLEKEIADLVKPSDASKAISTPQTNTQSSGQSGVNVNALSPTQILGRDYINGLNKDLGDYAKTGLSIVKLMDNIYQFKTKVSAPSTPSTS